MDEFLENKSKHTEPIAKALMELIIKWNILEKNILADGWKGVDKYKNDHDAKIAAEAAAKKKVEDAKKKAEEERITKEKRDERIKRYGTDDLGGMLLGAINAKNVEDINYLLELDGGKLKNSINDDIAENKTALDVAIDQGNDMVIYKITKMLRDVGAKFDDSYTGKAEFEKFLAEKAKKDKIKYSTDEVKELKTKYLDGPYDVIGTGSLNIGDNGKAWTIERLKEEIAKSRAAWYKRMQDGMGVVPCFDDYNIMEIMGGCENKHLNNVRYNDFLQMKWEMPGIGSLNHGCDPVWIKRDVFYAAIKNGFSPDFGKLTMEEDLKFPISKTKEGKAIDITFGEEIEDTSDHGIYEDPFEASDGVKWFYLGNTDGIGCEGEEERRLLKELDDYESMLNVLLHEDGASGDKINDNIEFRKRQKYGAGVGHGRQLPDWEKKEKETPILGPWPKFVEDFFYSFNIEAQEKEKKEREAAQKAAAEEKIAAEKAKEDFGALFRLNQQTNYNNIFLALRNRK